MMAPRSSCSLKMQTRTQKGKIPMTLSQKRMEWLGPTMVAKSQTPLLLGHELVQRHRRLQHQALGVEARRPRLGAPESAWCLAETAWDRL